MASVLGRIIRIARATIRQRAENIGDAFSHRHFETPPGPDPGKAGPGHGTDANSRRQKGGPGAPPPNHDVPDAVREDLAVFGLTPPSSMEKVRKARNREVKKYHSDHFVNDPERLETSTHIMQIFNTAYDRLEAYYSSNSKTA